MEDKINLSFKPLQNINFLPRRLSWSPDGTSILVTSFSTNNEILRDTDFLSSSLTIKTPSTVTSCIWYPLMDSNNPASCAFASVCPFCPIQLIDSNDGHIRASYRCQYGGDRAASLTSLMFNGSSIIAGGTKTLFMCDISRPDQYGIPVLKCPGSILSITGSETSAGMSIGLTSGDLIIVDSRTYQCVLNLKFHNHGLDSQRWINNCLITSARLENEIYSIDIRSPNIPSYHFETERKTSRYISLSSNVKYLIIGNEGNKAEIYDIENDFKNIGCVGNGPTPLGVISPKNNIICAASGAFKIIESEEEEYNDVSFEPCLEQFGLYY